MEKSIKWNRRVISIVLFVLVCAFSAVGAFLERRTEGGYDSNQWTITAFQGMAIEIMGAIAVLWLVDFSLGDLKEQLSHKKEKEELKQRLIARARSQINSNALSAIEELDYHGWLKDGTLDNIRLDQANLQNATLSHARMRNAQMLSTNLQGAVLFDADLADLRSLTINLMSANLNGANLQNAKLKFADLRSTSLADVDFRGADLSHADLQYAVLHSKKMNIIGPDANKWVDTAPIFDEKTILPDGTNWADDVDLSRFINPDHPNFWRSDSGISPAYRKGN